MQQLGIRTPAPEMRLYSCQREQAQSEVRLTSVFTRGGIYVKDSVRVVQRPCLRVGERFLVWSQLLGFWEIVGKKPVKNLKRGNVHCPIMISNVKVMYNACWNYWQTGDFAIRSDWLRVPNPTAVEFGNSIFMISLLAHYLIVVFAKDLPHDSRFTQNNSLGIDDIIN